MKSRVRILKLVTPSDSHNFLTNYMKATRNELYDLRMVLRELSTLRNEINARIFEASHLMAKTTHMVEKELVLSVSFALIVSVVLSWLLTLMMLKVKMRLVPRPCPNTDCTMLSSPSARYCVRCGSKLNGSSVSREPESRSASAAGANPAGWKLRDALLRDNRNVELRREYLGNRTSSLVSADVERARVLGMLHPIRCRELSWMARFFAIYLFPTVTGMAGAAACGILGLGAGLVGAIIGVEVGLLAGLILALNVVEAFLARHQSGVEHVEHVEDIGRELGPLPWYAYYVHNLARARRKYLGEREPSFSLQSKTK